MGKVAVLFSGKKGLNLGTELIDNGNFTDGSTRWSTSHIERLIFANDTLTFNTTSTTTQVWQGAALPPFDNEKSYYVEIDILQGTTVQVKLGANDSYHTLVDGVYSGVANTGSGGFFYFKKLTSEITIINKVSVKEILS